jgi:hypothetical protein
METLRRAVLRGLFTGIFFGIVILAFLLVFDGNKPLATRCWYAATSAFMTWFVATPQAALELSAAKRAGGLLRDVLAGLAGLAVGVPLVVGAGLQWIYLDAFYNGGGNLGGALEEVRKVARDLTRDPELLEIAFIFALPCGIVTFLRLRRTRWWQDLALSTGLTLAIGGLIWHFIEHGKNEVLVVIAGAGFALSLGTRLGDALAGWITSRSREDEPRETGP